MKASLRERTFGELVGLTFRIGASRFGTLVAVLTLFQIPVIVASIFSLEALADVETARPDELLRALAAPFFLSLGLQLVLAPFGAAACVLAVIGSFRDEEPTFGELLGFVLRRSLRILALGVVTAILIGLGSIACVVPGLFLQTWFYVAGVALVVEDLPWTRALARSRQLAEGAGWPTFGFFLFFHLLTMALTLGIGGIVESITPHVLVRSLASSAVGIAVGAFASVAPVVWYFQRRVAKEGFDTETLGALVDAIGRREGAPA